MATYSGAKAKNRPRVKSYGQAEALNLKVGAPVQLTACIDRTDGLVKGVIGIYNGSTDTPAGQALWIHFAKPSVGRNMRLKLAPLYTPDTQPEWTPIFRQTKVLDIEDNPRQKLTRCQFPIQLSAGRLLYRAQGITLDRVAVDLGGMDVPGVASYLQTLKPSSTMYKI